MCLEFSSLESLLVQYLRLCLIHLCSKVGGFLLKVLGLMSIVCNGTSSDVMILVSIQSLHFKFLGVFLVFVAMLILFVTAKNICDFLPVQQYIFMYL